jgi:type I restriction enzyme S subunit
VSDLPESWTTVAIGDLITLNPKTAAPDDFEAGFSPMPLLGVTYLSKPGFEHRSWGEIRKSYTHFADGDVLLAKITPCFENGKAGLVQGLPNGIGAGSSEYFVCRPNTEALDARYLLAFLKTEAFVRDGQTQMTGSVGHKRVPKGYVLGNQLPLAPRSEQKRIADKLGVLLARVDACRTRFDRVPALIKRFRQAVLEAAFAGSATDDWRSVHPDQDSRGLVQAILHAHQCAGGHKAGNASEPTEGAHDLEASDFPESWGLLSLRDCVEPGRPITYGILKPGPELHAGVPYVRVADFPNDRLNLTGIRMTSQAIDAEFRRSKLKPGDLLLSIRGTVGRLVSVPRELDNANITQDTARLSIQTSINAQFVLWYLRSNMAQVRMRRAIKGVAVRGINIGDVRALQVPMPPRKEQDEIVRWVESLFTLADSLEAKCQVGRAQIAHLTPALLAKAFRGELVPQDPNDEPADALLARLRVGKPKGEAGGAPARQRHPGRAKRPAAHPNT